MMEPLKILTNEFAENLGLGPNHKGVDSGYISPSNGILPTPPVKPFYDQPPIIPTTSAAAPPDQPRVDPLLLQQFLQHQPGKNYPQQQLINPRPITGAHHNNHRRYVTAQCEKTALICSSYSAVSQQCGIF